MWRECGLGWGVGMYDMGCGDLWGAGSGVVLVRFEIYGPDIRITQKCRTREG